MNEEKKMEMTMTTKQIKKMRLQQAAVVMLIISYSSKSSFIVWILDFSSATATTIALSVAASCIIQVLRSIVMECLVHVQVYLCTVLENGHEEKHKKCVCVCVVQGRMSRNHLCSSFGNDDI